jgi:hypothetical protein
MDNASRAWELPGPMRWARMAQVGALSVVAIARTATGATGSHSALEQANAALSAAPPSRDVARAALARAVAADDDPAAVGEAYFLVGELDEDDGAFARAMVDDRAAVDAAPGTAWALRASDRIAWLRARSEGDFAPLRRLEAVRRDPLASSDPGAIAALARDLEAFPPGVVRVEARMLVAEAWSGRMHRPAGAIDELRHVADDPQSDSLMQRLAERELIDLLVAAGRLDEAATETRAHEARMDPPFVKQVERLLVRRAMRRSAWAVLAAFALLAAAGLWRAGRQRALGRAVREVRQLAPVAACFVAFVTVSGGVLASRYESGSAMPFLLLGAGLLPLLLVGRAWSAVGSQTGAARAGRGLLCGATVVAEAFVVLDLFGSQYLPGFGL